MATQVTMPVLGLTMEEGTVAEWLKEEGDSVARDEPLLMVEMDKGTVEVPSPAAGVLRRIMVQTGTTVAVRTVIAEIDSGVAGQEPVDGGGGTPAAVAGGHGDLPPTEATPRELHAVTPEAGARGHADTPRAGATPRQPNAVAPAAVAGGHGDLPPTEATPRELQAVTVGSNPPLTPSRGRQPDGPRLFVSPRARMRARALGVDVSTVRGSGPRGRVVEADVLGAGGAGDSRVLATPLARRLAHEHGVEIGAVQGTGPGGRITQDDVLRSASRPAAASTFESDAAAALELSDAGTALEPGAAAVLERSAASAAREPAGASGEPKPLSRLRRITAERMAASAQATARVTLFLDADLTEAARFRQQLQPEFARLGVAKLPWDALFARAAALALLEHPAVLAQWADGEGLRTPTAIHVGVAVALEPEGLVVPVLRDAATRSLRELSADLVALVERARGGRLAPAEMHGGGFTITNLGAYRIDGFTPIVNPPETAILGVGRIAARAVVVDGRIEPRTMCTLSLSFDHRVVDGATAAAFLARLAELLERPYALLGI